jgi:long-chain fatty acid transport protein
LSDPWFPTPLGQTNTFKANLRYNDAWTIALGTEYRNGRFSYRIGHNYGKTPVTPDGMSPPQAGAIHQHNSGFGFGIEFFEGWKMDAGVSILYHNKVSGSATSDWTLQHAVFSPVDQSNIQVANYAHSTSASIIALLFGVSRAW